MIELNKIIGEIYNISPYEIKYRNKTEFKSEYTDLYGEITQQATNELVNHFKEQFNEDSVFYDLGCGLGKMVVHIGLQYNVKKSCGIELSKERMICARHIKETYCKDNTNISFIEGDVFDNDLSDATVIYVDNTAFPNELTTKIIDTIPKGCLFICRRKPIGFEVQEMVGEKFVTTYGKKNIIYLIKE